MDDYERIFIPTIILNFIIILITFFLILLYLITGEFYSYPCAHILNISLILCIDNIVRVLLIPKSWNKIQILQYFQAFLLVFFDKFILLTLTVQVFTIYVGIMKTEFYYRHEKAIFFSTFFGSLGISLAFGGFYLFFGIIKYGVYYYAKDNDLKRILDTIFNSVFLLFNTFFCVIIILNMIIRKEILEKSVIKEDNYIHSLYKLILTFISNSLLYIESYLIIYDKLPVPLDYIDLVYLVTCLLTNLIYSINKKVIYETKKLFRKKICRKKDHLKINTFDHSSKSSNTKNSETFDSYI